MLLRTGFALTLAGILAAVLARRLIAETRRDPRTRARMALGLALPYFASPAVTAYAVVELLARGVGFNNLQRSSEIVLGLASVLFHLPFAVLLLVAVFGADKRWQLDDHYSEALRDRSFATRAFVAIAIWAEPLLACSLCVLLLGQYMLAVPTLLGANDAPTLAVLAARAARQGNAGYAVSILVLPTATIALTLLAIRRVNGALLRRILPDGLHRLTSDSAPRSHEVTPVACWFVASTVLFVSIALVALAFDVGAAVTLDALGNVLGDPLVMSAAGIKLIALAIGLVVLLCQPLSLVSARMSARGAAVLLCVAWLPPVAWGVLARPLTRIANPAIVMCCAYSAIAVLAALAARSSDRFRDVDRLCESLRAAELPASTARVWRMLAFRDPILVTALITTLLLFEQGLSSTLAGPDMVSAMLPTTSAGDLSSSNASLLALSGTLLVALYSYALFRPRRRPDATDGQRGTVRR